MSASWNCNHLHWSATEYPLSGLRNLCRNFRRCHQDLLSGRRIRRIRRLYGSRPVSPGQCRYPEAHGRVSALQRRYVFRGDIPWRSHLRPGDSGAVAFGPVFPDQEELAHEANEYFALSDYRRITRFMPKHCFLFANADVLRHHPIHLQTETAETNFLRSC